MSVRVGARVAPSTGVRKLRRPLATTAPSFDPLVDITWAAAFFAEDPDWTEPADGGAVSQWDDGSGNGRHIVQATGANQPTYRATYAGLNSKPAVEFDGTNDFLLTDADFTAIPQPYSLVVIGKLATTAGNDVFMDVNGTSGAFYQGAAAATGWSMTAGVGFNRGTNDTAKHLHTVLYSTTSSFIMVDGTQVGAVGSGGANSAISVELGGRGRGTTSPLIGAIAFAGLYSGNITANGNWTAFKAWAAAHYAITIA